MRIIFFIFITFWFTAPVLSQKPSQKEIEAQKQEALNDARQQVAELKKEIADAKSKNEDPEYIKEMEKQLATLVQMVTMLEGTNISANTRPQTLTPSKTTEPKYISPFVPIVLNQTVTAPTKDNAKDHLLWYTGKKIDANTLITPGRTIIRYDRQRHIVTIQPDRRADTSYYGLVNTLAQTPQMKAQFASGMPGIINSFFMWPEILKAYNEYNFFRGRYYDLAKNTFDLNENNINLSTPPDPNLDRSLLVLEQDLELYVSSLPPLQSIVFPPKRPNDLCKCGPEERENYEDELDDWINQFYFEEMKILRMLKGIYLHLAFREQLGYQTTPLAYLKEDIIKAFNKVIERSRQKLWELSKQYQEPDIYVEEGLVLATLSLEKLMTHTYSDINQQSTITLKSDAYALIERIKSLIMQNKVFEKYMKDELAARNYNAVLDYSLYLSHEYNKKLIDPSYNIKDNFFQTWVEGLRKFNRFTLSINLDFEYRIEDPEGKPGLIATGSLESKKIVVSLGRSSCKWHLFISDVNQAGLNSNEDSFYVTMKVNSGTKTIFRDPQPPLIFSYSGPRNMAMVFPNFEITFCNTGQPDSVLMDKLRYTDRDTKAYMAINPKPDFGKEYSLDMFQFVNKMFVSVLTVKDNSNALVTTAGN
ncbi:MAG TPA: hypothetical protein VJ765_17805, partial [Chitinophagaceae bacterium]|nr:hypothetical protein [Chitinophagaceae bacterium]